MVITEREFVLDKTRYLEFTHLMAHVLGGAPTTNAPLLPAWHWLFTHETPLGARLGMDGHPQTRPPGVPEHFVRRLWVDSLIECGEAGIEFGQTLRLRTEVGRATLKQGKSGELAFVPVELSLSAGDIVVLVERRTGVYRPAPDPSGKPVAARLAEETHGEVALPVVKSIVFNEVDLFRYSALLKVYHRIHYDEVYATSEEGHPGLLVHGPLLGQVLIGQALRLHPGFSAQKIAVKACLPNYVNRPILLCVEHDDAANLISAKALDERRLPAMTIELTGA